MFLVQQGNPSPNLVDLQPWGVRHGTCNKCRREILRNQQVLDCRQCNHYICGNCLPQSEAEAPRSSFVGTILETVEIFNEFTEGLLGTCLRNDDLANGEPTSDYNFC